MSNENGKSKSVRLLTTHDLFPIIQRSDEEASRCLHLSVLSIHQVLQQRDPSNPNVPMIGGAQTLNYGPIMLQCRNRSLFGFLFTEATEQTLSQVKMVPTSLDVCRMCASWEAMPKQIDVPKGEGLHDVV